MNMNKNNMNKNERNRIIGTYIALTIISILIGLLVLCPKTYGDDWTPVDAQQWQNPANPSERKTQIGGAVRNYQDGARWYPIQTAWVDYGDSIVADKDIVRTTVYRDGSVLIDVDYKGDGCRVRQRPTGLVFSKAGRAVCDLYGAPVFGEPVVYDNTVVFFDVWPGVDVYLVKENGSLQYKFEFSSVFLDEVVSQYAAFGDTTLELANSFEYELEGVEEWEDGRKAGRVFKRWCYDTGATRLAFNLERSWMNESITIDNEWHGDRMTELVALRELKTAHETNSAVAMTHWSTWTAQDASIEDTYISENSPENNYGGGAGIIIGNTANRRTGLIRVSVSSDSLGIGATVNACTLFMYVSTLSEGGTAPIYRVFKPWVEGDENGTDNNDGDATWSDWASDASEWGTAGCNNANDGGDDNNSDGSGFDRKSAYESTVTLDSASVWRKWAISAALAQNWYDGDDNDNGVSIEGKFGTGGARAILASTNSAGTTSDPYFVFTYTAPLAPDPPTWSTVPTLVMPDSIYMTISTAASGIAPFSYQFEETSNNPGANDTTLSTTSHYDGGIAPADLSDSLYIYRARIIDSSPDTTAWSALCTVKVYSDYLTYMKLSLADTSKKTSYCLCYPVTYCFKIQAGAPDTLTMQYKYTSGGTWTNLTTKTSTDVYSGIECARFDYTNDSVYVSVEYPDAYNDIYLRCIDSGGQSYLLSYANIPLYYDASACPVVWSFDDWGPEAGNGSPSFTEALFVQSCTLATNHDIPIMHSVVADSMEPYTGTWNANYVSLTNQWIDSGYVYIANHSMTHDDTIQIGEYESEVCASRDTIKANLDLPYKRGSTEYLMTWLAPFGSDWSSGFAFCPNTYLSDVSGSMISSSGNYSGSVYSDGTPGAAKNGIVNFAEDEDSATIITQFTTCYTYNRIFHKRAHFYLCDVDILSAVFGYLDNRADVWYVDLDGMYMYRYLGADNSRVTKTYYYEAVSGGAETATAAELLKSIGRGIGRGIKRW